jgi:hypothetical protein
MCTTGCSPVGSFLAQACKSLICDCTSPVRRHQRFSHLVLSSFCVVIGTFHNLERHRWSLCVLAVRNADPFAFTA